MNGNLLSTFFCSLGYKLLGSLSNVVVLHREGSGQNYWKRPVKHAFWHEFDWKHHHMSIDSYRYRKICVYNEIDRVKRSRFQQQVNIQSHALDEPEGPKGCYSFRDTHLYGTWGRSKPEVCHFPGSWVTGQSLKSHVPPSSLYSYFVQTGT